jgi:DNA transformation protein and related proteins
MAVTKAFSTYVHEQLHLLPAVTSRRMFGGIGLYSDGLFFALLADDTLYCKVDDGNRADYVERGMRAFTPFPDKPGMSYYEVPAEVLEDAEELARWARKSVAAALVAANRKVKVPGPAVRQRTVSPKAKSRKPAAKRKGARRKGARRKGG